MIVLAPHKRVPWADMLFALLLKHPTQTTDAAFLQTVREFCGVERWKDRIGPDRLDRLVLYTLSRHPGVKYVDYTDLDIPVVQEVLWSKDARSLRQFWETLGSNNPAYLQLAKSLRCVDEKGSLTFIGLNLLQCRTWSEAKNQLIFLFQVHPNFEGVRRYLSDAWTFEEFSRSLFNAPDNSSATPVNRWKIELGDAIVPRPPRSAVYKVFDPRFRDVWVCKNLGSNITCFWMSYRDREARLYKRLVYELGTRFTRSRVLGTLQGEVQECLIRKLSKNAGSRHILEGVLQDSTWIQWNGKQMCSIVRDKGTRTLDRIGSGALTEKERSNEPEEIMDIQFDDRSKFHDGHAAAMEQLREESATTELLESVELQNRVFQRLHDMFSDEGDPDLWISIFQARVLEDKSIQAIADDFSLDRGQVRHIVRQMTLKVQDNSEQFSEMFGVGT